MFYAQIFANGPLDDGPAVSAALGIAASSDGSPQPGLRIAVDGGLRHLQALGLSPDIVIGDFDSADPAQLDSARRSGAEIIQLPTHKDETDLESALLLAASRNCDVIRIFGALGDRLDHSLGNIYLLTLPELRGRDVRLAAGKQMTWLAYPGEILIAGQPGDTVSLIPLAGDVIGIDTGALEYPLRHEILAFGPARGVSNVMLRDEARVSFEKGLLLIIHTVGRA